MIDINELRRLAQAATPGPWKLLPVGDKSKCFAVADINFLSVLTVVDECGTSFGAVYLDGDANFIAAANPATTTELLDRLEAAEKERDALQAKIEAMERQEPVGEIVAFGESLHEVSWNRGKLPPLGAKLYTLPGAPEQEPTRDWWDCLIADISAIDCMYRGSPTYAHDAYWMRDHVVWMLKKRRDTLPGAQTQGEEK